MMASDSYNFYLPATEVMSSSSNDIKLLLVHLLFLVIHIHRSNPDWGLLAKLKMKYYVKGKGEIVPLPEHHSMKASRSGRGEVDVKLKSFLISALAGSEWSDFIPREFHPQGKSPPPPYTLDRGLNGLQSWSGRDDC
jgi:hypothetical protein